MSELTAIIPTQGRASLTRAVASVLAQQDHDTAVVIAVDGRQHLQRVETRLSEVPMPQDLLRIEVLAEARGGGAARNAGVRGSRSTLVGFLDDDDEWLPTKSRRVIEALEAWGTADVILSHCYRQVDATGVSRSLPSVAPPTSADGLAGYLLTRKQLRYGKCSLQTSTLVTRRQKATETAWPDVKRHQDWSWLLESVSPSTRLIHLDEALTVVHIDDAASVSRTRTRPEISSEFLTRFNAQLPSRAGADFFTTEVLRRTPMPAWPTTISAAARAGTLRGIPHSAALALALGGRLSQRRRVAAPSAGS